MYCIVGTAGDYEHTKCRPGRLNSVPLWAMFCLVLVQWFVSHVCSCHVCLHISYVTKLVIITRQSYSRGTTVL